MPQQTDLLTSAFDRHRARLFGMSSLKGYTTSPEYGELQQGEFTCSWMGQRTVDTTTSFAERDSGAWQFQIIAKADWEESQSYILSWVALKVDTRRWKILKINKPIGVVPVWKIRAQMQ